MLQGTVISEKNVVSDSGNEAGKDHGKTVRGRSIALNEELVEVQVDRVSVVVLAVLNFAFFFVIVFISAEKIKVFRLVVVNDSNLIVKDPVYVNLVLSVKD